LASWYGHPYHGRQAANGEIYDMEKLTAAHRTLPFDTLVRVENLTNRKTVEVRITDRGPFVGERIIDLSHAAARAIELVGPGTARVRLEVLRNPAVSQPATFAIHWLSLVALERMLLLFDALKGRADVTAFEPPGTGASKPRRGFPFTSGSRSFPSRQPPCRHRFGSSPGATARRPAG